MKNRELPLWAFFILMANPFSAFGFSSIRSSELDRSLSLISSVNSPFRTAARDLKGAYGLAFSKKGNTSNAHYWGPENHCPSLIRQGIGSENKDGEFNLVTKSITVLKDSSSHQSFKIDYNICGFMGVLSQIIERKGNGYTPLHIQQMLLGNVPVNNNFEDTDDTFFHKSQITNQITGSTNAPGAIELIYKRDPAGNKHSVFSLNNSAMLVQKWEYSKNRYNQELSIPFASSYDWAFLSDLGGSFSPRCSFIKFWINWPKGFLKIRGDHEEWINKVSLKTYKDCINTAMDRLRSPLKSRAEFYVQYFPRPPAIAQEAGQVLIVKKNKKLLEELEEIKEQINSGLKDEAEEAIDEIIELVDDEKINDNRLNIISLCFIARSKSWVLSGNFGALARQLHPDPRRVKK